MNIYELRHLFYKSDCGLCQSELKLGFFDSMEEVHNALKHYNTQPGFLENPNAYIVRIRKLDGLLDIDEFFEAIMYVYSENYEIESIIDVGLYFDKKDAELALDYHNSLNVVLNANKELNVEYIVNRHKINQLEWREGFTVN